MKHRFITQSNEEQIIEVENLKQKEDNIDYDNFEFDDIDSYESDEENQEKIDEKKEEEKNNEITRKRNSITSSPSEQRIHSFLRRNAIQNQTFFQLKKSLDKQKNVN